jgi:hypothetical protein
VAKDVAIAAHRHDRYDFVAGRKFVVKACSSRRMVGSEVQHGLDRGVPVAIDRM